MNETELELTVRDGDQSGTAVVVAMGEVDASNCKSLEDLLLSFARTDGRRQVDVDLAEVSFIDSSGLRALIVGERAISEAGGALRVNAASSVVRRLFEITGLIDRLGLSD